MATFNFNFNTRTMFDVYNAENEVALTTTAQAVTGAWRIDCDVRLNVYTPNGALGRQALCYIDARPSMDTAAMIETGTISDTNPNRGRALRLPQVAEQHDARSRPTLGHHERSAVGVCRRV
jgi:hypothetical protein